MEEFNYNQGFQKQQASKILKSYGIDLEKALTHKYFKREGTPGHYKYYYTEADYKAGKSSNVEPKGKEGDTTSLNEAIADAKKIMIRLDLPFATIWKTGKSYGFNFDKKEVGFSENDGGVKRTVVQVIKNPV